MLTTDEKGAIAEAAIAYHALRLGVPVSRPLGEGGRYDLIFDLPRGLTRVQCKWAQLGRNVVIIRCYSARRAKEGLLRRPYTDCEIDAYAAFCADLDSCYFLPYEMFPGQSQILLRVTASRNNQRMGVNWAADYEFAATLRPHQGAVAQLGERAAGSR